MRLLPARFPSSSMILSEMDSNIMGEKKYLLGKQELEWKESGALPDFGKGMVYQA